MANNQVNFVSCERLSRWTEAKGEHGFSKDPTVPTRVLKKTNTKPRTPKVSFGASRDVFRSLPERDWEEDGRNGKSGRSGRNGKSGRRREDREEELGRAGGPIAGEAG